MYHIEGSEQEIFNQIVEHLAKQKCRASEMVRGLLSCRYRTDGNKKCAIGCLIPDQIYDPSMEGRDVNNLVREGVLAFDMETIFVASMQAAHDLSVNLDNLRHRLKIVAENHNLDNSKIDLITEWRV